MIPVAVCWCSMLALTARAIPKSATSAIPSASSTFPGLMSLWTTPCWCAYSSALAISRVRRSETSMERGFSRSRRHPQRLAFDVGHDVIELPVDLTRVVQWQDVRVCKPRSNLDLPQETLVPDRCGHLGVEGFDRDLAAVLQVVGQVDDGHASAAKLAPDPVTVGESFFQRRCLVLMFADSIAKFADRFPCSPTWATSVR